MTDELALPPPKFSKTEFLGLKRYDAMVLAIAECQEVDEVKKIREQAKALEIYSKEAKNYEHELRAMDIRIRASKRAGELLVEMEKRGEIAKKGQPRKEKLPAATLKTLDQLGISRDQSASWKALAGMPEELFEEELPERTGKRTSVRKIVAKTKKISSAELKRRKLHSAAMWVWGRVRDIPDLTQGEKLSEVVGYMDKKLIDDLRKAIPEALKFLENLQKEIEHAKPK